ncbi:hypothetical protein K443DRAFT_683931 [Laccaria amethystina LaAM-08-1]|uniref:Uncharacterized protein n=1 Tax=Laccaria amethystina LaAM-08-1 TaxID=1095629 RepID=A0A0C9WRU4_9AGAR|nr:hypothetical protein K443DRAFT_683931 [Laccaria amethystina LaAM-08-1]
MRFSSTLALIALVLGVTSMAHPLGTYPDLTERDDKYIEFEARMFDIDQLEPRRNSHENSLHDIIMGPWPSPPPLPPPPPPPQPPKRSQPQGGPPRSGPKRMRRRAIKVA